MRYLPLLCLTALIGAGCASEYSRRSPSGQDPSNPESPPSASTREIVIADPLPQDTSSPAPAGAPGSARDAQKEARQTSPATAYTCPMHPEVRASRPGRCPKCGMKLIPVVPADAGITSRHDMGSMPGMQMERMPGMDMPMTATDGGQR